MRINQIELQGFKSFVDRTVLKFGSGVAGIVGPNGCGKSNVVDAIRWVLGEQHPKTLRGRRMEDMVFNGSDSRRPAAMSEVTITFADITGRLSAEWTEGDEITVTRRLFRSGESEYLINHKPSRLRDVVDLFLDTGINTHSFSIVEQGRIEALLTAKVDERREVIEEAAGIMKYKTRRNEALRKLQAAQDNLDRINDIVGEVERQTRSLERQAKRAAQYKEVHDRLREVEGRVLRADYAALEKRIAPKQAAYDEKKRQEAELRAEWSAADGDVEARRQEMARREEGLHRLRGRIHDGDAEVQRLETRIELFREQKGSLEAAAEIRKDELNALRAELTAASEAVSHARAEAERQGRVVQEAEEELARRQADLDEARRAQTEREGSAEADKALVLEMADRFTRTQNRIQLLEDQLASLERRKSQLGTERDRDSQQRREAQENLEEAGRRADRAAQKLEEARSRERALQQEVQDKTGALSRREEAVYRLKEDLASKSSSLSALEGLARSMDGSGLEALFDGKAAEAGLSGILSPLADLLEVEPGFETAIESVLGERLRGAVVEGLPEAKAALEFLQSSGSGRGSLIPKSLRVPIDGGNSGAAADNSHGPDSHDSRVLGKATDFVRTPAEFDLAIRGLLGDVRIVRDFDAALSLWEESEEVGVLVTRGGEVLYPSGIAVGGMDGDGPLQRRNAMEGLRADTARLQEEIAGAQTDRETEKNQREQVAGSLEECVRTRGEAEAGLAEIRREIEGLTASVARLDESLEVVRFELERVAEEENSLRAEKQESEGAVAQIGRERAEAETRARERSSGLAEGREKVESAAEAVASQRVELAEIRARAENLTAEIRRFDERCSEIRARMDRMTADAEADRVKCDELEQADHQGQERIRQILQEREEWKTEAGGLEEAISQDQGFLRDTQERARSLKDRVTALLDELEEMSAGLSELKGERDLLCQRAQITYGIDLTAAPVREEEAELTEEERESLREEGASLQDRLRRIGDVNMGALSEFEQLNERYQFLKGQQEDLVRSIRSLHETIDRINRTTRGRFKSAFEAINESFSEVFRRLFGGGRASLFLTDESNLLETGVDILVQPPGKKLGNILLLSAGEKALTAIALLFAVFRYNPSPFCLLDEVDATLDDHNIARFIDILRDLSLKTQFIVITHNKRTMSFADVLYGVTMGEKGVSRVVSVELHQVSGRSNGGPEPQTSTDGKTPSEAAGAVSAQGPSEEDRWAEIEAIDGPEENGRPGAHEAASGVHPSGGNSSPPDPDQDEREEVPVDPALQT